MNEMTPHSNADKAEEIAAALKAAGIESSVPDPLPDYQEAGKQAYLIWNQHLTIGDWRKLRDDVRAGIIPRKVRYRKIAKACENALRQRHVPENLVEPMTFAWGIYHGLSGVLPR
ncbi:MAG: hypothetical protein GW854_10840 [Erythrobacter sp.]|nr:hypothetical protein [Erythrobacter sp.]